MNQPNSAAKEGGMQRDVIKTMNLNCMKRLCFI